jgi:Flp pilus assembly pilin Flp
MIVEIEFYGLLAGFAFVALIAGIVAVITGWRSGDQTRILGLVAITYVGLVQTLQSLWD